MELPKWLESLKEFSGNWQLFRNNHAWKHLQEVLCIITSIGLCKAADLKFNIAGYEIISESMLEAQKTGTDLIDAILNVTVFFSQGAYLSFKTGSLRPLLLGDTTASEIDEEYVQILKMWDLVHSGNLEKVMTKSESEVIVTGKR